MGVKNKEFMECGGDPGRDDRQSMLASACGASRTPREYREREKDDRAQSARVPTSGTKFSEGTPVLKQRKDKVMGMAASVLTFLVRQRHWEGTWL